MLKNLAQNTIFKKSLPLFIGTVIANIFNYFFHISLARMLGPEEFGVFFSLLSFILILSIFPNTINLVSAKISAECQALEDYRSLYHLFAYFSKKILYTAVIFLLLGFIILNPIADFLKIPPLTLMISLLIIPISFLLGINRGYLKGLQTFKKLGLNLSLEGVGKFVFGIILVYLGLKAGGAITAIILTFLIIYILSIFQLKPFLKKNKQEKKNNINIKDFFIFSFWAFLLITLTQIFFNIDVILVKHFLPPLSAGQYSALAVLGKIMIIISLIVTSVMFPNIINKKKRKIKLGKTFRQSILIVSIISLIILLALFLFSGNIIKILFGKAYLEIKSLAVVYGLSIFFFGLSNVFLYYFLAIKKGKVIIFFALIILSEIILISIFHQTLIQIISIIFSLMLLLLLFLIISYFWHRKKTSLNI